MTAATWPGQARAATIELIDPNTQEPSGWRVSWSDEFDQFNLLDVAVDAVVTDPASGDKTVFIQKSAEFTQGPAFGGVFPPIVVAFTQIDADAASEIVIIDEIITNSTGTDWFDFHMTVMAGTAVFDPVKTDASAGGAGFSVAPFSSYSFSENDERFNVDGGVIPDGTQWFPGAGPSDGELYISVQTGTGTVNDPFRTFALKEFPSIPEPAAIAALLLGAIVTTGRRR